MKKIQNLKLSQINNPDKRVEIIKKYVTENFPSHPLLDYAIEVEKVTTSKVHKPKIENNIVILFVETKSDSQR